MIDEKAGNYLFRHGHHCTAKELLAMQGITVASPRSNPRNEECKLYEQCQQYNTLELNSGEKE